MACAIFQFSEAAFIASYCSRDSATDTVLPFSLRVHWYTGPPGPCPRSCTVPCVTIPSAPNRRDSARSSFFQLCLFSMPPL